MTLTARVHCRLLLALLFVLSLSHGCAAVYNPFREYVGGDFFRGWAFGVGADTASFGNVTYVDQAAAAAQRLAYVSGAGRAIIRVDNSTQTTPAARSSIYITTQQAFTIGHLIVIDASHVPAGCSVWPSFRTIGIDRPAPANGEMHLIDGVNRMDRNQMSLQTSPGCMQDEGEARRQTGQTLARNCNSVTGCVVADQRNATFGTALNAGGGGVWALQMAATGIYMWFWPRSGLPENIRDATSRSSVDTNTWGTPTAIWSGGPGGCQISSFFTPQRLVLRTTICGGWAGVPSVYQETCQAPAPGTCVANLNTPNAYNDAYWEIRYVRVYIADDAPASASTAIGLTTAPPTPTTNTGTTAATSATSTFDTDIIPIPSAPQTTASAGKINRPWGSVWLLISAVPVILAAL